MKPLKHLIALIDKSASLSKKEKQRIIREIPTLTEKQLRVLANVFLFEQDELQKINDRNNLNLESLKKEFKELINDFEHRLLPQAIRKTEKKARKKEIAAAEKLLKEIDSP